MNHNMLTHNLVRGIRLLVIAALLAGLALGVMPMPVAHADTHTVCAVGCDFTSIQDAINGAVNGHTISVTDATHTEPGIAVNKNLTIQGQGASNTTVQANAARGAATARVFSIAVGSTVTIRDMTIRHGNVTSSGGGGIRNQGTLTLENVTVKDNDASDGGGIYNGEADLTLTNCTVSGNTAGDDGGGIYQQGETDCVGADTLVLLADGSYIRIADVQVGDATLGYDFVANRPVANLVQRILQFEADSYLQINGLEVTASHPFAVGPDQWGEAGQLQVGDGVAGEGFTKITHVAWVYESIDVYNLTVAGTRNFYVSDGSDLFLVHNTLCNSGGQARLNNVTITDSIAGEDGAVLCGGQVGLNNVTITDNTADDDGDNDGNGGGVYSGGSVSPAADSGGALNTDPATFSFRNTIIAGNNDNSTTTNRPDCSGSLASQGYNLVGKDDGCTFTSQTGDQRGNIASPLDPRLSPLADNGGPTETHALLPDSPAIDAIPEAAGGDYNGAPGTDQRGVTRPQGDNCDIGAYEAGPPTGESTDSVGVGRKTYTTEEIVYATGSGFPANTDVDVYIVGDDAWTDGMVIPPDVSTDGMNTVPTDGTGDLVGPANVWPPPLTPGEYDMVFDVNQNGVYNAGVDVVDDPNHPGFVVQSEPVGGIAVPVNRLGLLAPWLGLVGLAGLAALTVALVRKRGG